MNQQKTVFVGLSGGVDSSVAALRLKREGHTVVGVFIKVWQPDFIACNWEEERLDAMRVAAKLDIPFLTFDAEEVYKKEVVDYMIGEYTAGRTPNPDVMCNQYVKFGVFLEYAKRKGADAVASGHYAQIENIDGTHVLKRGKDQNKDQSYFLWTLRSEQRKMITFPVGNSTKDKIRGEAKKAGLMTATKHDSQGICFLGKIDMKEFLSHYVKESEGPVLNEEGKTIGTHSGALFYTIGQRHGFQFHEHNPKREPRYIIRKNVKENTITVSKNRPSISEERIYLEKVNQILPLEIGKRYSAQSRYRQTPFAVSVANVKGEHVILEVHEKTDTPTVGQSCVVYDGETCIGGGIITHAYADNQS